MTTFLRPAFAAGMVLSLCLLAATPLAAEPKPASDPLIGLWGGRIDFGAGLKGPLSLSRTGSRWRARIAGAQARAPGRVG